MDFPRSRKWDIFENMNTINPIPEDRIAHNTCCKAGKTVAESAGWALNEHGAYDSHIPENFAYLHFKL